MSERLETELLSPTPSPLVAGDPHVTLLVLHFPAYTSSGIEVKNQEIDFIVGERFVITVRYEVIAPLYQLRKILETDELVSGETVMAPDVLLEVLFAHLYAAVRDHMNHAAARLTGVERQMVDGRERTTVRAISQINREFLHLESAIANQEGPLERFMTSLTERKLFGPSFADRALRIMAAREQVAHEISTQRAFAKELRETNAALLEARQNEIMKTLTVITVIILPLTLIADFYAMEVQGAPFTHDPNGFWILIAFMALVAGILVFIFARKRWLF